MTDPSGPDIDARESEEVPPAAAGDGRTAFDALNPYGDFGGTAPEGRHLLALVAVCVFAVAGLLIVGGVWAMDAFRAGQDEAATTAAHDEAPATDAPAEPALLEQREEPATAAAPNETAATATPPATASVTPPAPAATTTSPPGERPEQTGPPAEPAAAVERPAPRRRPPPPPERALVLTGARDRSDSVTDGLDEALEQSFLERVRQLVPTLPVKRTGRPKSTDVGVRVILTRLHEASGGGAHDVTAECALATRPKKTLPDGPLYTQGKSQGVEKSAALHKQAVGRCGARLADALAPILQSLK